MARRDPVNFSVSLSSSVISSFSSSDWLASTTSSAVISLVMDAIGSTADGFFENRTSLVSWSTT